MTRPSRPSPDVLLQHAGFLRALARRLILDESRADDVVQQSLVAALEARPDAPRPWLARVARNFAFMAHRADRRRARRERAAARPESLPATADVAARLELQRRVVSAVLELDEPYRSAVVMRYYEDLPPPAIAERLGVPVATVKTRLRRALQTLRARLDAEEGGRRAWSALLLPLALPPAGAAVGTGWVLALPVALLLVALGVVLVLDGGGMAPTAPARRADGRAQPAPAPNAPEPPPARATRDERAVHGFVRDKHGAPIAGATVTVLDRRAVPTRDRPETTTDADGAFVVSPPHRLPIVRLALRHDDHAYAEGSLKAWLREPQTFVMPKGAPVAVRAVSPDGAPLSGAAVSYRVTRYEQRSRDGGTVDWDLKGDDGTTDAQGRYWFGRLPDCELWVRVHHPLFAPGYAEFAVDGSAATEREIRATAGGVVEGTVRTPDGAPAAGARVYVTGHKTTADAEGRYRLAFLKPGKAWIKASLDGFAPAKHGTDGPWGKAIPVVVADGETFAGVDLRLKPAAWAVGRVVDDTGAPVAGIDVGLQGKKATTDADGRFRAGPFDFAKPVDLNFHRSRVETHVFVAPKPVRLEPAAETDIGEIRAVRRARVCGVVEGAPFGVFPTVYGGGRVDLDYRFAAFVDAGAHRLRAVAHLPAGGTLVSGELELELAPGEVRDNLVLTLREPLLIRGAVGRPDVRVEAWHAGRRIAWAQTGDDGTFALPLVETHTVEVRLPGFPGAGHRLARARDTGVDFVLPKSELPGVVTGRVLDSDGQPVQEFGANFVRYVFGIPTGTWGFSPETPDGRFRLELEKAGSYALQIDADHHATLTTKAFTLRNGGQVDLGTLRLQRASRITGAVRDAAGQPVAQAQVHLLGTDLRGRWSPPVTDHDGRFELAGVAAGTYSLFVVSPRHPLLVRRGVEVGTAEDLALDLVVSAPSPLTIVVRDKEDRPVRGAELVYTFDALKPFTSRDLARYEPKSYGANESGRDGVIAKPYLPGGAVELRIEKEGYRTERRTVVLTPGEPTEITVRLR